MKTVLPLALLLSLAVHVGAADSATAAAQTAAGSTARAPLSPAAVFAMDELADFKLSPDGAKVGFIKAGKGGPELCVYDVATKTTSLASRLAKNSSDAGRFDQAVWFGWAPPQRLLVAGLRGKTRPPSPPISSPLTGEPRLFSRTPSLEDILLKGAGSITILDCSTGAWTPLKGLVPQHVLIREATPHGVWDMSRAVSPAGAEGTLFIPKRSDPTGPSALYQVDLATGEATKVEKYPSFLGEWLLQADGSPRIVASRGPKGVVLHQLDEKGKWAEWATLGSTDDVPRLHGVGPDGQTVIATREGSSGRRELAEFDLVTRAWREPLASDPRYDIAAETDYAGITLSGPLFSPVSRRLLGVRYFTERFRSQWSAPQLAALQQTLDRAFPGASNAILGTSENGARAVVFSWSDREPGRYLLADLAARRIDPLGWRIPGIDANEMGATTSREIRAWDGTMLDAYLTLPPGEARPSQPLVILAGHQLRNRAFPAFNPFVQVLATHGLAVLQVNHRGVDGYGRGFARMGRDPAQGLIHQDIADAARWAVVAGVADPRKIAIVGENFGGFLALYALGHSDLYRCGVAMTPITDWETLSRMGGLPRIAFIQDRYMKPDVDGSILRAQSPRFFAEQIKTPLLVLFNERNPFVPRSQAVDLVAAIKRPPVPVETLFYNTASGVDQAGRAAERMLKFLLQHLGDDPAPGAN